MKHEASEYTISSQTQSSLHQSAIRSGKRSGASSTSSLDAVGYAHAFFDPMREEFKNYLFKNNGITQNSLEKIKSIQHLDMDIQDTYLNELLQLSTKAEDWLEICFYSEQNPILNHERLWLGGLEKFNSSALYLENLGYFYYQKGKFLKSLDYLNKSHVMDNSFFALSLAIAAAYAVTQYHLVLDYYSKLVEKDRKKLDEDLLMKVATSAQYEKKYDLAIKIFEGIRRDNDLPPLPDLKESLLEKFGSFDKMKKWVSEISIKIDDKALRKTVTLEETITLASALISENKFEQALNYLELVKFDRYMNAGS